MKAFNFNSLDSCVFRATWNSFRWRDVFIATYPPRIYSTIFPDKEEDEERNYMSQQSQFSVTSEKSRDNGNWYRAFKIHGSARRASTMMMMKSTERTTCAMFFLLLAPADLRIDL